MDAAKALFRKWFTKVWQVRGGGLYAVGWAVSFVFLEATTIISELVEADGIVEFFKEQLFEFLLRFMSDSIINMVYAFVWPVYVVQWQPPIGAIALGIAFWLFPIYVKPHITAWLFDDADDDKGEPEGSQQK